jgi:hypothetical protein
MVARTLCGGIRSRTWLGLLAALGAGLCLAFLAPVALASSAPVIESASVSNVTEHGASLEAQINAEGLETTYEMWLDYRDCQNAPPGVYQCESISEERVGHGQLAAGDEARSVSADLSQLEPGYSYSYRLLVTNSAGKTESLHPFEALPSGACPNGCTTTPPYENSLPLGAYEASKKDAEEAPAREAARQQAAREQAEREVALARPTGPGGGTPSVGTADVTGGVSLADADIAIQAGHVARVKLDCLGAAGCHGKLTLSAKLTTKTDGEKRRTRAVTIGSASFSIPGDDTKTVKIDIDAGGRALRSGDHGHLEASLAILELAPSPANTQTKSVHLSVLGRQVSKTGWRSDGCCFARPNLG